MPCLLPLAWKSTRIPGWTFFLLIISLGLVSAARPVRVLIWDEQQPRQRTIYPEFLGNRIAAHLGSLPGLTVRSTRLDDPQQGLSKQALDQTDVLIWWGHVRQQEISPDTGRAIVNRIQSGQLSLIVLHSAHWSTPFVEAMRERARQDALQSIPADQRPKVTLIETNRYSKRYTAPKYFDPLTPSAFYRKYPDGNIILTLTQPNCCFPGYRPDAKPSQVRTLLPDHPIARGIPDQFEIPQTEMYDEPFHVPPPDAVIFEERWAPGEWFRSGSVWKIGSGRVFYFRPGHETYPVFKQPACLKIIENAVRWLGSELESTPAPAKKASLPGFSPAASGEYTFDTRPLRGTLRHGGKSLGLSSVLHSPSGKRLDGSNGLLSHYRVFTKGVRYGAGAWDWPSGANLVEDGSVEVKWPAVPERPFRMRAVYRWRGPTVLDLETVVEAERDLTGFESFVAAYFSRSFTNAAVYLAKSPEHHDQPGFLPARASYGHWLMFPRDATALGLIQDGRWNLQPHPVSWTIMPVLKEPIAWRHDPESGLTVVLMSPSTDCFAIAMPYQTEGHYSIYFSLFGRDLKASEVARARMRLVLTTTHSEQHLRRLYQNYLAELGNPDA